MAEFKIQTLPEEEAIEQIVETVKQAETGAAPFALVLGSGFSHGLVPTARELVEESLPLWVASLRNNEPFEQLRMGSADQRNSIARTFWQRFVEQHANRALVLPLGSVTGLPEDYAAAYKAAFDPHYFGAVGEPAQARKFQRALMRLDQTRLNAAHFLLASLLGVQPGKSRRNELFKARAAFCRLILTTNFDPFLQTALQTVNRLYFMSDTPELGVSDEILDDQTDAIHLVYLHGSIHRRSQAATDEDIKTLKEKNARTLAPVLKRHGVIVLGYSGWDDAIVEALAACDRFDHRLYWCGRESNPLVKGAFGPRVADILRKPATLYLKISSAGHFMAQLCTRLVDGLPRLLGNPIGQLREMLETIDLKELEPIAAPVSAGSHSPQPLDGRSNPDVFVRAQRAAIERLIQAEQVFLGGSRAVEAPQQDRPGQIKTEAQLADLRSQALRLLSSALVADALGNYEESLKLCTEALGLDDLQAAERAELLIIRGLAFYSRGRTDEAVTDWTKVIELPDAPVAQVAHALVSRGITWGQKGDTDKALADYSRVIEQLPDAPVAQVARALANRGWENYKRNAYSAFLADTESALHKNPELDYAAFNLGLALLVVGRDAEALVAYRRAAERFPNRIETDGLYDLAEAQKSWLTEDRAKPVIQLLRSLKT
jgi:tetratricopeptide (TPR) repeat protein